MENIILGQLRICERSMTSAALAIIIKIIVTIITITNIIITTIIITTIIITTYIITVAMQILAALQGTMVMEIQPISSCSEAARSEGLCRRTISSKVPPIS